LIDNEKSKSKKDSSSKSGDKNDVKTNDSHEYDELGHDMSQIGDKNVVVKRK
jgi:hypothetical protein